MNKTRIRKKPVYRPVLKLPPLPHEQFLGLRDNIAVHGVLQPIIVDSDGARRRIIDGNYRKRIADELGYDCPEIVQPNLEEDEKRTLARALNLARRQLTQDQRRRLIADQLEESPERSNRWIGKQLGNRRPRWEIPITIPHKGQSRTSSDVENRSGTVRQTSQSFSIHR